MQSIEICARQRNEDYDGSPCRRVYGDETRKYVGSLTFGGFFTPSFSASSFVFTTFSTYLNNQYTLEHLDQSIPKIGVCASNMQRATAGIREL
ncbi:hypothetical protein M011DRAFT_472133, partial [Sporormia fimetaria CBS 119925]